MPEMAAPRALVFRPLVKGNEAMGTRLLYIMSTVTLAPAIKQMGEMEDALPTSTDLEVVVTRNGVKRSAYMFIYALE